jgi:hypothetical protein
MNQITNIKQSYHMNLFGFELLKILDWKHVYLLFTYSTYECKWNKNYCIDKHQVWIEWKLASGKAIQHNFFNLFLWTDGFSQAFQQTYEKKILFLPSARK